ncbi:MAG: DUF4105 domain-containing protein [Candidatus Binatia bacterium]
MVRGIGWVLVTVVSVVLAMWGAAALHYSGPRPAGLSDALAVGLLLATVATLGWVRPLGRMVIGLAVLFVAFSVWWGSRTARNDRDWQPDVARPAHVEIVGDTMTVQNLRNFDYRSETDFTEHWETRTYDLSKLSGVDLFMSYWGSPSIAHTIMSWDFSDGQHLAISIETRKEKGEVYSPIAGFFKQYELYYVVADERDVVRLRSNYRKEQVYLFPMRTPVVRARRILLDYVASINALDAKPDWYNAATANCTTTILTHVKNIGLSLAFDRRLYINGHLDELLYERGIIDTSRPYPELRQASQINARAEAADRDPAFSTRIREGLRRPPLLVLPTGGS